MKAAGYTVDLTGPPTTPSVGMSHQWFASHGVLACRGVVDEGGQPVDQP